MWHLTTLLLQVMWWGGKVFVWLSVLLCKLLFFSGHPVPSLWRNILLTDLLKHHWLVLHRHTAYVTVVWSHQFFRRGGFFECASQGIDSSLWKYSKKSNGMLQSKSRKPDDQSVCGKMLYWCGFVAAGKTRQINLLRILCLCIWTSELTSQGARPRSSHLFLLLSSHSKQSSLFLVSLDYLTKRTKDLFIF